jgi:hypothetical protein
MSKDSPYFALLLNAVHSRIQQLECEIQLMDKQLPHLGAAPGTTREEQTRWILMRNIKAALHDIYIHYSHSIQKLVKPDKPLHRIVQGHLFVLQQSDFQIRLQELYGQQSALTTLVGPEYHKFTNDEDASADVHMKMMTLVFPYEFAVELLTSSDFFTSLLEKALAYNPTKHLDTVTVIFHNIAKWRKLGSLSARHHFFTPQNPMYFSLAEHFLTPFVRTQMLSGVWNSLKNFSCAQKCALLARQGAVDCGLGDFLVSRLKELTAESGQTVHGDNLRRMDRLSDASLSQDPEYVVDIDIVGLSHVILELRRLPYSPTPSTMMGIVAQANEWLTNALHACAGQQVGADEIFQFFVFCLSVANLWCLPAIHSFVNTFIDDALRETVFEYYIQRIAAAMEFVDKKVIPVEPFLLLPARELPRRLEGVLEIVQGGVFRMKGFEMFAFPSWSGDREKYFPALPLYTGASDQVVFYQYKIPEDVVVLSEPGVDSVLTMHGRFFQLTREFVAAHQMSRVDGGDFEESGDLINTFSTLMQMVNREIQNSKTSGLTKLYEVVARQWNIKDPNPAVVVPRMIADLQRALIIQEFLPQRFAVNGVLCVDTLDALRAFFGKNQSSAKMQFVFNPRLFEAVMAAMKRVLRPGS